MAQNLIMLQKKPVHHYYFHQYSCQEFNLRVFGRFWTKIEICCSLTPFPCMLWRLLHSPKKCRQINHYDGQLTSICPQYLSRRKSLPTSTTALDAAFSENLPCCVPFGESAYTEACSSSTYSFVLEQHWMLGVRE